VPKIDVFLAGRNSPATKSKDNMHSSTSYVTALNQILIESYSPVEYSYLLTTGKITDIRETFKENKDFATNETLLKNRFNYRIPD
jgi:hypothetical protein